MQMLYDNLLNLVYICIPMMSVLQFVCLIIKNELMADPRLLGIILAQGFYASATGVWRHYVVHPSVRELLRST